MLECFHHPNHTYLHARIASEKTRLFDREFPSLFSRRGDLLVQNSPFNIQHSTFNIHH
jgi:hypothetical protein